MNLILLTNVIRFILRAIIKFNYKHALELNSSELNSTIVGRINRAYHFRPQYMYSRKTIVRYFKGKGKGPKPNASNPLSRDDRVELEGKVYVTMDERILKR